MGRRLDVRRWTVESVTIRHVEWRDLRFVDEEELARSECCARPGVRATCPGHLGRKSVGNCDSRLGVSFEVYVYRLIYGYELGG